MGSFQGKQNCLNKTSLMITCSELQQVARDGSCCKWLHHWVGHSSFSACALFHMKSISSSLALSAAAVLWACRVFGMSLCERGENHWHWAAILFCTNPLRAANQSKGTLKPGLCTGSLLLPALCFFYQQLKLHGSKWEKIPAWDLVWNFGLWEE